MKRILRYHKNREGITIVLVALMLVVLLMFLGMAVDIAYMYFVKNQLQAAADAAALAGGANISRVYDSPPINPADPPPFAQLVARQQAWRFACKNRAANQSVFLETDDGRDPNTPNCDSPPTSGLNETANTITDDIVVGNWSATPRLCSSTGLTENFCPANGLTGLKVNALRARPRRTNETPGMPQVGVFVGQIFRMIGTNWSLMSASASAIASSDLPIGPFPLCQLDCGSITALTITSPNLTPGTRWFFKHTDGPPNIGWTTFLDNDTSQPNITDYVLGNKTPPDVCTQCIYTTEGLVQPSICAVRERIRRNGRDYVVNGVTVHGWKVLIPIFPPTPCPTAHGSGCLNDPSYQPGDPYPVIEYAPVIITDAVPNGNCPGDPGPYATGKPGLVLVGSGPGVSGFSSISCIGCADPALASIPVSPQLVK